MMPGSLKKERVFLAAGQLIPVILLFWLYWNGLKTWFVADDFAWLGLIRQVHSLQDVIRVLFVPAAQGTIRPWSERGFFMLFESLFGLDALPFRVWVFMTATVDVILIGRIGRSVTGSAIAGAFAAILWVANTALQTPMAWTSAYNEILCTFFILTATALFIRYAETGRRVFWWWQLVVFVLGFGALEVNVVYPALAAAYVLFVADKPKRRRLLLSLTPLFLISVTYFLIHLRLAPVPKDGPYAVHVDSGIFRTLALYWEWSLIPSNHSGRAEVVLFWLLTMALAAFFVRQAARSRYCVWFFLSWFLIALAPVVALPNHHTDYYVTIPLIGLAMLGGLAIARAFAGVWGWRILALALLAAYLRVAVVTDRAAEQWWLDRSQQVRGLVLGAAAAEKTHPGKTIVLDGISSDIYAAAVGDSAFTSLGLHEVYLTPESAARIDPGNNSEKLGHITLEPGVLRHAIADGDVVIYADAGDHLRNITSLWEASASSRLSAEPPHHVEAANPLDAYLLGTEWYPSDPDFRWMPRRATVHLAGPRSVKDELVLEGYCPEDQLKAGPLNVSAAIDGIALAPAKINGPPGEFHLVFSIPPSLIGTQRVDVAISVDRSFRDAGGRELGLVFGMIAIQ